MNQLPTEEFRKQFNEIRTSHQASLDTQMGVYLQRMDQQVLRETLSNVSKLLENIFDILDDIVTDPNPNPDRDVVIKFINSCREHLKNDFHNINLLNYKTNRWSLNFNILNQFFNTIHVYIQKGSWISVLGQVNTAKVFLSEIGYEF